MPAALNKVIFVEVISSHSGCRSQPVNSDMNTISGAFKMYGDWKIQSALLKDKFSELTDSDLDFKEEEENALLRRLEKRLNLKTAQVIEIIKGVQPARRSFLYTR